LVENQHGQVSLRTKDKKIVHVSISDLSPDDQKYVLRSTPPDIDVDVSEITDRHNEGFGGGRGGGFQIQYGTVQFRVTLTKSRSYSKPITVELYIIGSQSAQERYGLLGKTIKNFSFDSENVNKFEFMSDDINMRQFEAGGTLGAEYEGYLVVLVEENGNVFKVKGSRSMFEEHAETIRKQEKGAIINQEGLLPLRRFDDIDGRSRGGRPSGGPPGGGGRGR
jgi:hypothetical protein